MQTRTFTDQLGRQIMIPFPPKRIISLVPSQTELLFDLGLDEQIKGLTKFCVHPAEKVGDFDKIGGTKKLDLEKIRCLRPDLIIGNKEENDRDQIETLTKEFPVWMSDIFNLTDALEMIRMVGEITGKGELAAQMSEEIEAGFKVLPLPPPEGDRVVRQERANETPPPEGDQSKNRLNLPLPHRERNNGASQLNPAISCLYLIWKDPYMLAGADTFIDDMLSRCGLKNLCPGQRYPIITPEDLKKLNPAHIFLSSEPYPFKEKHVQEMQGLCPGSRVQVVDGEMFSWYGSRLRKSVPYLKGLIESLLM